MSLPAQASSLVPSRFLICKRRLFYSSRACELKLPTFVNRLSKLSTAKSYVPQRLISSLENFKDKLCLVTPLPLKDFHLQDAEAVFLQQLLLAGKKALKQFLLLLYICSFVSDVVYSISRNKELIVPLGLFMGYVATNFLAETSKELFHFLEEDDIRPHLVLICCLFALAKIISTHFVARGKIFLLHIANGGLMQALWLWKNYQMTKKDIKG